MENKSLKYDIGGNLVIGIVLSAATLLGTSFMNFKIKSRALELGVPIKDNSEMEYDFDPKTMKFKIKRKTEFEVKEKTIIKEVPVVTGFKKTKKVQVDVDKDGNEIPGTQQDIIRWLDRLRPLIFMV